LNDKQRNWTYIFIGLATILSGILLMFFQQYFIALLSELIAVVIFIMATMNFIRNLFNRFNQSKEYANKNIFVQTLILIGSYILSSWLFAYSETTVSILGRVMAGYLLLIGTVQIISYFLLKRDQIPDRFKKFVYGIANIIFAYSVFNISMNHANSLIAVGIYLILAGLTFIEDGRGAIIPHEKSDDIKRKIRFPLPVIFHALLPRRIVGRANEFISKELAIDNQLVQKYQRTINKGNMNGKNKIQVQFTANSRNVNVFGHIQISVDGKVYNYGNYDVDSRKLAQTVGDGVIAEIDKDDFFEYTLNGGSTIVEYDLVLSDNQMAQLRNKIDELKEKTEPWTPTTNTQRDSNAGRLVSQTDAHLYKFTESKYRTYFVCSTNCVMLVDDLIGLSGLDLFVMVGVLTPGTYFDYFEKEYEKQNSIIVDRRIYNQQLREQALFSESIESM